MTQEVLGLLCEKNISPSELIKHCQKIGYLLNKEDSPSENIQMWTYDTQDAPADETTWYTRTHVWAEGMWHKRPAEKSSRKEMYEYVEAQLAEAANDLVPWYWKWLRPSSIKDCITWMLDDMFDKDKQSVSWESLDELDNHEVPALNSEDMVLCVPGMCGLEYRWPVWPLIYTALKQYKEDCPDNPCPIRQYFLPSQKLREITGYCFGVGNKGFYFFNGVAKTLITSTETFEQKQRVIAIPENKEEAFALAQEHFDTEGPSVFPNHPLNKEAQE